MPDLKLYTVLDLRNWLLHNQPVAGLTESVAPKARAWAVLNNPYVSDKDPVFAAIYEGNDLAAYTGAFPELIDGRRVWWFSTLWCDERFLGQGYGLIVVGSLVEVYGLDNCADRWGAAETVQIFSYLGLKTTYTKRFVLGSKPNRRTVKGRVAYLLHSAQVVLYCLINKTTINCSLSYLPFIDDNTYAFIEAHRGNDYFLHSKDMLNWELQYLFKVSSPLISKCTLFSAFPSETTRSQVFAVKVCIHGRLIAFYVLKLDGFSLSLLYLYYDHEFQRDVYESILKHILTLNVIHFVTDNEDVALYIRKQLFYYKYRTNDVSLSIPDSFASPRDRSFQLGDGDNFI